MRTLSSFRRRNEMPEYADRRLPPGFGALEIEVRIAAPRTNISEALAEAMPLRRSPPPGDFDSITSAPTSASQRAALAYRKFEMTTSELPASHVDARQAAVRYLIFLFKRRGREARCFAFDMLGEASLIFA